MLPSPSSPNAATPPLPQRHRPSQTVFPTPNAPTIVFLTVCTHHRTPWLANPKSHTLLIQSWQNATAWFVGSYIIMPDHIHLFCAPGSTAIPIATWSRYWKRLFTIAAKEPAWTWQSSQWHRRMRTPLNYRDQHNYMEQNPVRAGLCEAPHLWPYRGKIHDLPW